MSSLLSIRKALAVSICVLALRELAFHPQFRPVMIFRSRGKWLLRHPWAYSVMTPGLALRHLQHQVVGLT